MLLGINRLSVRANETMDILGQSAKDLFTIKDVLVRKPSKKTKNSFTYRAV
jgi:hypothetical protein